MMKRLIFWQNIISPHQVEMINELALHNDNEVVLICEKETYEFRKQMKWNIPTVKNVTLHVGPDDNHLNSLVKEYSKPKDFNIISGLACFHISKFALRAKLSNKIIMAEAPDQNFFFRPFKLLRDYLRSSFYARDVIAYLCIGKQGLKWFKLLSSKNSICYPFTYTVKEYDSQELNRTNNKIIIYIGSLIKIKRVDLLIKAYKSANFREQKTRLVIIGDGPELLTLKKLAASCDSEIDVQKTIDFMGSQSQDQVYQQLSFSDVLVLPSRHDGWGAVVNEALQCGCQVIVSDRCGSCDVINELNGAVFEYPSMLSLKQKLEVAVAKQTDQLKIE